MKILAIESSFKTASCAISGEDGVFCYSSLRTGLTHSQTLMVLVENMFKISKIAVEEITAVGVAVGPGSFTGLRIGVSAAKGFCFGLKIPCVGISSLLGFAKNLSYVNGIICSLIDARNDSFYVALFRARSGKIDRLWQDEVLNINFIAEKLNKQEEDVFLVGDGSEIFFDRADLKERVFLAEQNFRYGSAKSIAMLALEELKNKKFSYDESLAPKYIRLSQAEQKKLFEEFKEE